MPPYDQDDDVVPAPAAPAALRELVRAADAVFFATPEYNSSIPGALKNALDWASRPLATNAFRNKPVAVISSSAGVFGGVWAPPSSARCSPRWARASPRSSSPSATRTRSSTTRAASSTTRSAQGSATRCDTLLAEVAPVSVAA